ncbi:MAG TPA: NAD(P)H-binding protein [Opitutales bacterium]|nr:NAD(P)H-binding protein [Opitutales bacterium]
MKTETHPFTSTITHVASTLVLGGNGKTGRRIVERLEALDIPVRIGSRSASPSFDWNAPENWESVLQGIEAVYIAYFPDLAVPGATEHIRQLVAKAERMSVKRIVLLSGRGEEEAQLCERIVQNSTVSSTILRCGWFNQNFSESFLRDMVIDGTIALPANGVREPFVDADDIADVAVAALTEARHAGKLYEITGPRLMTFAETAAEIAEASGRVVQFIEISREDFREGLQAAELPAAMVNLIDYLFAEVLDGRNEYLGDGIQQALGREPRDFSEFVRSTAAQAAWV